MIKLYLMDGKSEIQSFDLFRNVFTIGRSPQNDIPIQDKYVSRRHIKITKRGDSFFIKDLGSRNGTFVKGKQLPKGHEFEVEEGVPIILGMSLVCLGKACLEKVMPFVDSLYDPDSDELNQIKGLSTKDRPLTAQKNMETIYNVARLLRNSLSLEEIMEKILGQVFSLLPRLDRGFILLADSRTGRITQVFHLSKSAGDEMSSCYSRSIVDRVLRDRKAISMLDTFSEEEVNLSESIKAMRIRSLLCIPMVSNAEIRGVMYFDSIREPHGFRKEDLSLLIALSSPAAIAIENALLRSGGQVVGMN
ncbi:MAG: FHA domain-containing protein [Deltaproteobacteria bacterium]